MKRNFDFGILHGFRAAAPLLAVFPALAVLPASPATAKEDLVIYSDHSTLMTLPQRPATVIVGNPSIADVTLDGERLFLHGRNFGSTNVMILDDKGQAIGDYQVSVTLQEDGAVSVFKNGERQSFICAGDCQPTLTVGDKSKPHFEDLASEIQSKATIALSQKGGDQPSLPVSTPVPFTE